MDLGSGFLGFIVTIFFLPYYLCFNWVTYIWRSLFPENLAGKVVLIIGASSGIGEHVAYEYGKRGALLVIGGRRDKALRDVGERAFALGSPVVVPVPTDISHLQDCTTLIQAAIHHFGRLDHLVITAGVTALGMFQETYDVTNFSPAMDVNFWGVVYAIRCAAPYLRIAKGKIVVVASAASWLNAPWLSFYNASKAAVASFVETMRIELAPDIGITLVTPGLIESEITKGKFLNKDGKIVVDQDMRDVVMNIVPIERVGRCAKAIVDSACRGDKYLTWPPWVRATLLVELLCPEVVDWFNRWFMVSEPPTGAISKKIIDLPGLKDLLWPDSVRSPKIKTS